MPYVITEPCIGVKDKSCVDVCPVEAIYAEADVPKQWEQYTQINAEYFEKQSERQLRLFSARS